MTVDVLILYEHVARELESALLLKAKLEQKGYYVKVAKIGWNDSLMNCRIRPKIIITPWCYDNNEVEYFCKNWIGGYEDNRIKILNLHCEQISGASGLVFTLPKNRARDVYHLVWGDFYYKQLRNIGIPEELIIKTGCPRMDFYVEPYKNINISKYELAKEFSLDSNKKWLLIIGNFSLLTQTKEQLDIAEKKGFGEIKSFASVASKTFSEVSCWFEQLARDYRDLEIIYRPHPNEKLIGILKQFDDKYENFHVIKKLSVRDWIVNSNLVLEWCSTSGIEAAVADVPVLSMRPVDIPESLKIELIEEIEHINNYNQLKLYIDQILKGALPELNKNFKKAINYYYYLPDESACDEIVKTIDSIFCDENNMIKTEYNYIRGLYKSFRFIIKKIAICLGIRYGKITDILVNDLLSDNEMQEYIERIKK